uniref:BNR/Asp-box repeat protein n=1 Tax=CrAss-like virus sp. ctYsL76 TaxID=2826826 RepID=A0A8S5QLC0_9CAUD|nr:MAG TPA: BNR/Asp-box repeat protein [CrAss-like virus sp. ctYsL76]
MEYSIDGGETWLEYPNSENIIPCLFGMTQEYILRIDPLNNKENITSLYKTRVTISCKTAAIYSRLNKIVFYVSTNGSSGCTVDVSSCTRNSDVFTDIATGFDLSG